jgi:serine/threonine protein kinase
VAQDDPNLASALRLQAGAGAIPAALPDGLPTESKRYGPGDRIAENYRLRRLLGQGGMGDVWLAHNEALDVDVAVKLVRPASGEKDAAERLLGEARAAARLGHPAIVRVFDFGQTASGDPFIVMEHLEGEDLGTALGRLGRLRPPKAIRTLLPIAHALMAAHGKGIVHRDLKPENVFLARVEGDRLQPKIVDFGIAQVDRAKTSHASLAGGLLGSPAYMAPEQARGGEVDHRADVWSFSVVLYEVIAGRRPFIGDTPEAVLHAIVSAEPAPFPSEVGVDGPLFSIIQRGLAKNPADRFPSMKEFGETLAIWLLANGVTEDITGASLDTVWGSTPPPAGDLLGSLRPAPALFTRESLPESGTLIRGRPLRTKDASGRLVGIMAGIAAILGLALGVILGAKPSRAPIIVGTGSSATAGVGPSPTAGDPRGTRDRPSDSKTPTLVQPLDRIPVDGAGSSAGPNTKGVGKSKRRSPPAPKRILKDPFR